MTLFEALHSADLSLQNLRNSKYTFEYSPKNDMLYALVPFIGQILRVSYQFHIADLFADDWEIVPKPQKKKGSQNDY